MRFSLFLLLLAASSCRFSGTAKKNIVIQPAFAPQPTRQAAYQNNEVWKKMVADPDTASFSLQVNDTVAAVLQFSGIMDSLNYRPIVAKLTFSDGRKQVIRLNESPLLWQKGQPHPFVRFEDLNFDGARDLLLFDNAGVVNFWYRVWLYKPWEGFSYNENFSNTPCLRTDPQSKGVLSYYYHHDGCGETVGYFMVSSDSLQPVYYLYNSLENDTCFTYRKKWTKEGLETEKLGAWEVSLYDSVYHRDY